MASGPHRFSRTSLPRRQVPSGVLTLLIVGIAVVLAYVAGTSAGRNVPLLIGVFVAAPALLFMLSSRLEQAVILFLVYMTFEGLLKNVAANTPVAYLLRDVFLFAMLGKLLFREPEGKGISPGRKNEAASVARLPILFFILVTVVQVLNPSLDDLWTNLVIGLGGIHQRILPIVLFFATLRYVRSRGQAERLQRLLVYLGIIVAIVLLIQIAIGQQRWMALGFSYYSQGAGDVYSPLAERYGVPRPASIAQDAGAAAWFILTALFIAIGHLTRRRMPGDSMPVWVAVAGFLLLALALTFMRTAYMSLALGAGIFLLLRSRHLGGRIPILAGGVLLTVFLLGTLMPGTYMDAIYYRAQMSVLNPIASYSADQGGRLSQLTSIPPLIGRYPIGAGTGRTGPGQANISKWVKGTFFLIENGFAAVILEGSVVAGVAVLLVFLAMISQGFLIVRRLRDSDLQATATALLVCIVATLAAMFSMNPLDASPFNVYFWLLAGLLMALPPLDTPEEKARGLENRLRSPQAS